MAITFSEGALLKIIQNQKRVGFFPKISLHQILKLIRIQTSFTLAFSFNFYNKIWRVNLLANAL